MISKAIFKAGSAKQFHKYLQNNNFLKTQSRFFSIKIGSSLPDAVVAIVKFDEENGFVNEIVDIKEYFENKNVVLIGYIGAFAPTCMTQHIPQFIQQADFIKAKGADEIIATSVNDPFVVQAFAEYLGGRDKINFIADGNGEFAKALGLEFDLTAVQLGPIRNKRFTMIVKNNRVVEVNKEDGAQMTEISCLPRVLDQITPVRPM